MANEIRKVKIKTITTTDKFVNVLGEDGIKYGIAKDRSPNLVAVLAKAKEGDEISGEYFLYKDNHYLSDPKEGKAGGKSFAPKDKSFEAAQTASLAAAQFYSLDKEKSDDKVLALAEKIHGFIMGKVTKSTEAK